MKNRIQDSPEFRKLSRSRQREINAKNRVMVRMNTGTRSMGKPLSDLKAEAFTKAALQ